MLISVGSANVKKTKQIDKFGKCINDILLARNVLMNTHKTIIFHFSFHPTLLIYQTNVRVQYLQANMCFSFIHRTFTNNKKRKEIFFVIKFLSKEILLSLKTPEQISYSTCYENRQCLCSKHILFCTFSFIHSSVLSFIMRRIVIVTSEIFFFVFILR